MFSTVAALALRFLTFQHDCSETADLAWIRCGGIELEDGPFPSCDPHVVRACFQAAIPAGCWEALDSAIQAEVADATK